MLDPRRLSLLVALHNLGTVRAVAAHASMSPSAVSQALSTLEAQCGTALLFRHGRSVRLTPAGVALARDAVEILDRIDAAQDALRDARTGVAGVVRVGAFSSALSAFVLDAAKRLTDEHPALRVQLSELEPERTLPALDGGAIDVAVVADMDDGTLPRSQDVDRVPLASDELHTVLPPGLDAGRDGRVGLAEIRDEPWIVDGTDLEHAVVAHCRRAGFEPRIAHRLFSHGTLLRAVEAGLGVTVLPTFALEDGYAVRVLCLTPTIHRRLFALTRAGAAAERRPVAVTREAIVAAAARRGAVSGG